MKEVRVGVRAVGSVKAFEIGQDNGKYHLVAWTVQKNEDFFRIVT